jgi:Ca2+:H+ antiporter
MTAGRAQHPDPSARAPLALPLWTWLVPVIGAAALAAALWMPAGGVVALVAAGALIGCVVAAVHHAEVVAHRVGEPFGTLVLAIAITVIEVALIVSLMMSGEDKATLPRDTVYSTIMIICNGVVGICILVGGVRHHEQAFRIEGANSALAALATLSTLCLVLPTFTVTAPGPSYTTGQLAFAAVASVVVWSVFVFVQTVRHREYFLPLGTDEDDPVPPPTIAVTWASAGLLLVALAAVVGLAKSLSPGIERIVAAAGAPQTMIGIAIALLVLLPETWAAIRAALANRLQTSLNLALGSALASIGLTIPAVAAASVWLDVPLVLGVDAKDLVMLVLTFMVGSFTLVSGRTSVMQGAIHLVIFAAFLFLSLVP